MAAVGYKLTVRPTPSPIRSDQAGWAALVSSSDEDTKPELSPSTQNYDTDSWPLFEPTALALASTARSRQDDVVFDNSRQPNFCCWLQADMPSPEIDFRFTPNSGHSSPMSVSDRGPEANFCWKFSEPIMGRGYFGGLFLPGVAPAGHCNGSRDGGGCFTCGHAERA